MAMLPIQASGGRRPGAWLRRAGEAATARLPANCSVSRLALFVGALLSLLPARCRRVHDEHASAVLSAAFALPSHACRHSQRPPGVPPLGARTTHPRRPCLPPTISLPTVLVSTVVLAGFTFDAQKIEGLLVWVQDNPRQGSVLFLVRSPAAAAASQQGWQPPLPPA